MTEATQVSPQQEIIRRWLFSITDWEDTEYYVNEEGEEIDYSDAQEFIGGSYAAEKKAERRANMWEEKNQAFAARLSHHSQGIVPYPPERRTE